MPNLLAMSFEGLIAPSFTYASGRQDEPPPDGYGLAYFPGGEPAARLLKEPARARAGGRRLLERWGGAQSSLFVMHVRRAQWGAPTDANTQPFARPYAARDWVFAHAGSLDARPEPGKDPRFEPVGSTDTEVVFCLLLERVAKGRHRTLAEVGLKRCRRWLDELGEAGDLSCVITDGHDLFVYADPRFKGLQMVRVRPPYKRIQLKGDDLRVDLTRRGTAYRKGVIVSSDPLQIDSDAQLEWELIEPGRTLCIRQGEIIGSLKPAPEAAPTSKRERLRRTLPRPKKASAQLLEVCHETTYRYKKPVERSTHLFRMEPLRDRLQQVESFSLEISVDGQQRDYEDVFGNRVRRLLVETPFTELSIVAKSRVRALDRDPLDFRPIHQSSTMPLVWMPWQRQVLQPYLLPPELPETQLLELSEYAMSFVERNDHDLLETVLDINQTIFAEYAYRQGSTTLATTAFHVYSERQGVCQDFTNLFICLARLLGVPARYVCGYIYTGPKNSNQVQSEASHAWVQVYLPEVGWRGFDPTNGILTQTDHVRVAVGRNYIDATPTSGTIYVGGGKESLKANVRVDVING